MAADWFRSSAWDASSQEDFERRLARARPANRPQYIRIKALAIAAGGQDVAAQVLFERVVRDYANSLDCRASLENLADMARMRGDLPKAEETYRRLLTQWPDLNATTGLAEVSLAEVLLDGPGIPRAVEALALLESAMRRGGALRLNANLFRWHVALIRAAEVIGDRETVKRAATTALRLADRGPQLARHPTVGLVAADPETLSWLRDHLE
jgi:hypothetical protein